MSLSEFDKQTVELIPDQMIIPRKIELPQYEVEQSRVSLEYINEGIYSKTKNDLSQENCQTSLSSLFHQNSDNFLSYS